MNVQIKLSSKDSYRFELSPVTQSQANCLIYNLVCCILSNLKTFFLATWQLIDKTFSTIDCGINTLSLRYAKIQSCGFSALNHSYRNAPLEQKKALEQYILSRLDEKFNDMTFEQRQILAHKIATDHKIYDIGGLCLGYSWLFAAYVLSHKDNLKQADSLKNKFLEDVTTKTCPIISFANYINFEDLIQRQGSQIVIQGEALRDEKPSLEKELEAIRAIRKFAYPSFKLESDPAADSLIDPILEATSLETSIYRTSLKNFLRDPKKSSSLKKEGDEMTDLQKCINASNLEEQILAYSKFFDKKSLVIAIPTQDPTSGHAICVYANEEEKNFIFFDPNIGVTCFTSLKDLAKGVSSFSKSMYGAKKAEFIEAISI